MELDADWHRIENSLIKSLLSISAGGVDWTSWRSSFADVRASEMRAESSSGGGKVVGRGAWRGRWLK